MSSMYYDMVKEFHSAYDVPMLSYPQFPAQDRIDLRRSLIVEEIGELLKAIEHRNMVETADGISDAIVVLIGTALEFGIPLDKVMEEVHASNMSKLGEDGKPVLREDGKVMKGPNFRKPDIQEILINSRWDATS